jgi:hypothetical protein
MLIRLLLPVFTLLWSPQVRIPGPGGASASSGGSYNLLAHTSCASASGPNCTTSAIDCTGASLIVGVVSGPYINYAPIFTDSSSNTYSTGPGNLSGSRAVIGYAISPTVTSSMTFTDNQGTQYSSFMVACFSANPTPSLDQSASLEGSSTSSTFQPGSITPAVNNSLVVASLICFQPGGAGTSVSSVGSSFTMTDQEPYVNGTTYGGALAYLIQGTAAAVNPLWTMSSSNCTLSGTIASFKP